MASQRGPSTSGTRREKNPLSALRKCWASLWMLQDSDLESIDSLDGGWDSDCFLSFKPWKCSGTGKMHNYFPCIARNRLIIIGNGPEWFPPSSRNCCGCGRVRSSQQGAKIHVDQFTQTSLPQPDKFIHKKTQRSKSPSPIKHVTAPRMIRRRERKYLVFFVCFLTTTAESSIQKSTSQSVMITTMNHAMKMYTYAGQTCYAVNGVQMRKLEMSCSYLVNEMWLHWAQMMDGWDMWARNVGCIWCGPRMLCVQ